MFFLISNIIFASIFMLTIKWVQVRQREDVVTVGAISYIASAVAFLPEFILTDVPIVTTNSVATGCMMGACYFVAYFFAIYAIKWIGASAATVISALSLLVPIVFGVYVWKEDPNAFQIFGIGLSLIALMLIGGQTKAAAAPKRPWFSPMMLVVFFLLCGCSRLAQEAFKHICEEVQRPTFIVAAFTTAAVPSLALLMGRRRRVCLRELGFGALMGLCNVLQIHFILKSLELFDGFIVFPVVGAGGLVLTALVATSCLGESLSRKTNLGIAIACLSLVLLNWMPSG